MGRITSVVSIGLVLGICAAAASGCSGGTPSGQPLAGGAGGGGGAGTGGSKSGTLGGGTGGSAGGAGSSGGAASSGSSAGSSSGSSAGSSAGSSSGSSAGSSSGASVGVSTGNTTPVTSTASTGSTSGSSAGSSAGASSGSSSGSSSGGSSGGSPGGSTSGAASAAPSLTKIYINDSAGSVYEYDSANWSTETLIARSTGAFSISSGPAANTLYLQEGSGLSPHGPLWTLDIVSRALVYVGGDIPGNAFGEGRNGFLYSGSGWELYRVNPANGSSTYVGDGTWPYAGDLAVDPTTDILYGAVGGQWTVDLVTVDRNTGAQTVVGPLGVTGDIWGLGFSGNGDLFAGGPTSGGQGAIFRINKATGAAALARNLNYEPYDMATQPYAVPEDQVPSAPGGGSGASASPDAGAALAGSRVYFEEGFELGATPMRWVSVDVWEKAAPTAGPRGAASGTQCMATRAGGGYPDACKGSVETPPLDLSGARRPVLTFRHWYDIEDGKDGGVVRVRTPRGELTLEPTGGYPRTSLAGLDGAPGFTGRSRAWVDSAFDLSALAGRRDVRIAFVLGSDWEGGAAGWFVDDIVVSEGEAPQGR